MASASTHDRSHSPSPTSTRCRDGAQVVDRPTAALRLSPCDSAVVGARAARRTTCSRAPTRFLWTRSPLASTNWVCCSRATRRNAYWSARSCRSRRRASSHPTNNATSLQVWHLVLAGWCGPWKIPSRHRRAGRDGFPPQPRDLPALLGPGGRPYTDWMPLHERNDCAGGRRQERPWQFKTCGWSGKWGEIRRSYRSRDGGVRRPAGGLHRHLIVERFASSARPSGESMLM